MALTPFQRDICRLLADNRIRSGESYVAGGAALNEVLQPLGYLAWAACGKDPGFSPRAILDHAARATRYSAVELEALAFEGPSPDPAEVSRRWHEALRSAAPIVSRLPAEEAGKAVLSAEAQLFRGDTAALEGALRTGTLFFHAGAIRGAFPRIVR